jgi:hypothetical protein
VSFKATLINDAVKEGLSNLANQEPRYVNDARGQTLINNLANSEALNTIFWDASLNPQDRVDKIVDELMTPNSVDGLVSGQIEEDAHSGAITVRPFVIVRANASLVTESRNFTNEEFNCPDPDNPNKQTLCQRASEDIRDTVVRLLKRLH